MKIILYGIVSILLLWWSFGQRGGTVGIGWVSVPGTQDIAAGTQTDAWDDALVTSVIQTAVNWVLSMLWFIALLVLLYWWFLMVTAAGNEDRYNTWFTILKQVAIWIVLIWVAWLIVSMIFRIIDFIT